MTMATFVLKPVDVEMTTCALPITSTKKCPVCEKVFDWYGEQWVYRDQHKGQRRYFCSWTCWRKVDKKSEKLRGSGYHGD